MDISKILNQFMGASGNDAKSSGMGGLAGGALAGGAVALLLGNKTARKFAGNAATVGGMALLGSVAYQAYRDWQGKKTVAQATPAEILPPTSLPETFLPQSPHTKTSLELTIVKAMIAAARADGQIDTQEQASVFKEVQARNLSAEEKSLAFDLLSKPILVQELAATVSSLEQKSEVYLASFLTCQGDHPDEKKHLAALAEALNLPGDLVAHLEHQGKSIG